MTFDRPVRAPLTLSLLLPLITASPLMAADDDTPFPFAVAWDDTSSSVVDSSALVPPLHGGQLRAVDGHLVDSDRKRVRLLGVNLVAGACFPEAGEAPIVARRLRRLGVTCVRLHLMDAVWARPNLFSLKGGVAEHLGIESLTRLDGLIAALADHGIRVDLNLHVGRNYGGTDLGYPASPANEGHDVAACEKVVGFFDKRAGELQRQYARELLDRVNPKRGMRLADDPVLAMVELANEDSLVGAANLLPELPDPWQSQIRDQWNAFLRSRYGTTVTLLKTWNAGIKPTGKDLLMDGQFINGAGAWVLEQHPGVTAELGFENPVGATNQPDGRVLRVTPTKLSGTDWHLQMHRLGLKLIPNETYTLSFAARASAPRKVYLNTRLNQPPWSGVGLDTDVKIDSNWARYSVTFTANGIAGTNDRLSFVLGDHLSEFYLADVTLKPGGGGVSLLPDQVLETGRIPVLELDASPAGRDLAEFLIASEDAFCQGMRRFIREDLKCQAPIVGSQASYGGIAGLRRESRLDMVDMHAYWQHPSFPGNTWDENHYRIENSPMAKTIDGGALRGVAQFRAAGLPFTVSEYDHPAPSEYAAEVMPLAFAMAARQDWDGVFLYNYQDGSVAESSEPRIATFFNHTQHPAKLAFYPIAAEMFLAGGMPTASGTAQLGIPATQVIALTGKRVGGGFWQLAGPTADTVDFFNQRMAVSFTNEAAPSLVITPATTPAALTWTGGDQGHVLLHAPRVAGAIGLIRGQAIAAGALRLTADANRRNFAAVAVASRDAQPLPQSRRMLLAAVDKAENSGLKWAADRHSATDSYVGTAQVTGVSGAIELTTTVDKLAVWALDGRGVRTTAVPSAIANGTLRFRIEAAYRTVWYEISAP